MTTEVVYETHSTTTDNEQGRATGWLPGKLSEAGRHQARKLGERRRNDGIAAVFVSDLARAIETAEIAFAGMAIPMHHDARLRECNYGVLNGMSVKQLALERFRHVDEPFPSGQSYRDVVKQMAEFLQELAESCDGQRVLLIGHSANKWALDHLLKSIELEDLVGAPFDWQEGWTYSITGNEETGSSEAGRCQKRSGEDR